MLTTAAVDYFYYAQLVSQGEESTAPRESTGQVPLDRIPDLMRALGYYPTEQEVQNMSEHPLMRWIIVLQLGHGLLSFLMASKESTSFGSHTCSWSGIFSARHLRQYSDLHIPHTPLDDMKPLHSFFPHGRRYTTFPSSTVLVDCPDSVLA